MKMPPLPDALLRRLEPLIETERKIRERKALAIGMLCGSLILLATAWAGMQFGWPESRVWLGSVGVLLLVLVIAGLVAKHRAVNLRAIARRIEREQPDLETALLAALEQKPGEDGFGFLQQRVVVEAVLHAMSHDWQGRATRRRQAFWGVGLAASTVFWLACVVATRSLHVAASQDHAVAQKNAAPPAPVITVTVRPGDTEIERGTRLIVEAKFAGGTPTDVVAVLSDDAEGKTERARVPMKATVEANAFGGMVQSVDADGFYRVVFSDGASQIFKVTTYVHPALVRADATITPPAYSGLPVKEVKNTQNVSALEGSQVKFRMKVNKPVAVAELYGEDKTSIPLTPTKDDPLTLEGSMEPKDTQKYRLHLVDAQERANKQPPWFKVSVLADQPPKVEIVFPKRDLAVSPIQEMPLEAKVWDDLGVQRSGAVFMLGSETHEVSLSNAKLAAKQHHDLKTVLELEKLKVQPRQLVSYYVWAEDVSPEGKSRRSQSDMFFAEVRHFEDIFREGESPEGDAKPGEQGGQAGKLGRLQKQVVNADWKVLRDKLAGKKFEAFEADMKVVKESQDIALQQTQEAVEKVEDAEVRAALTDAGKAMQRASDVLDNGLKQKKGDALNDALTPEREALEALYRAQGREHKVMRSQKQMAGSKSASEQMEQRQLSQLEMKQKEKRYEEEKAAGDEKESAEQQENLQVLNRLKELARRQEALAEKIKELEQQMAQAKTDEQRNELAQQLKRLQEEQEQLLRDLDNLKERMEQPQNQSRMAQEMKKLEDAREQVRQAAEQLAQQQTGSASNAATRAQENLEQARDEFRQRTAKRFAEEMRRLKQDAAGLAEEEQKLSDAVAQQAEQKAAGTKNELQQKLDQAKLSRQVGDQRESLEKLMEQMRQISDQAEQAEPLLSTALNDTARRAAADGIDRSLEDVSDQLRYGTQDQAQASERKAAKGIDQLQQGVEKAAESVLGSETESLRMARSELDRLLNEVNKDAQKGGQAAQNNKEAKDASGQPQQQGKPGDDKRMAANEAGKGQGQENKDGKQQPGETSAQQGKDGKSGKEGQGNAPSDQQRKEESVAANSPGQGQQPSNQEGQQQQGKQGQKGQQGQNGEGKPSDQAQAQAQQSQQQGQGQAQGQGQGQGQGQQQSSSPAGEQSPQMAANEAGQQPGQGAQRGQGQGQAQDRNSSAQQDGQPQRGQTARGGPRNVADGNRNRSGRENGGGGGGGWFFDDDSAIAQNESPLTGAGYDEWSDRLRRVEEALTSPELRNQAARVLDNAREMRTDWRRNNLPPQSDTVSMHIVQPLVELRDRVAEELARRESGNPLSPLDRDPVPHRYRELVRRYYTELGGGK